MVKARPFRFQATYVPVSKRASSRSDLNAFAGAARLCEEQ
ncbi:hypothetical protein FAM8407_02636 [Lacticaseibacillus paracasei]|uniref:Uncharacterized protein n=1 Tax=Lacticaseibacillus paracasei subsp. paracasei TaxID=47714 RepID=A0AAP9HIU8_LACPA|nr:Hypothetical protein LCAKO_2593 [Lacticaseibacillus paracasei subsp. paracasei]RNE17852.1 hypothetical protein FAM3248_01995 [Lacticaseibacillus paracasei]RNE43490.1 hypothetical protein FAM8407_02636 [Lacticaseibacillus paracasei]